MKQEDKVVMKDDKYEREIDLKEIFFRVLYGWRKIIIIAFVFAVFCGGYNLFSGMRTENNKAALINQETAYQNALSTYETSKSTIEKEIRNLTTSLERQIEYNNNAIIMQINPFDEQMANITYYIDMNYQLMPDQIYQNFDTSNMVISAYVAKAENGEMYNYIIDNLSYDIDIKYLKELISIEPDFDNHMLHIQVIHSDKTLCEEIFKLVCESLNITQENINESVGVHILSVINQSIQSTVDFDREKEQKTNLQNVEDYKIRLTERQAALSALVIPTKSVASIRSVIKYAIIGFFIGAILIISIIIFSFMMSDKILSTKDFRKRYCIRILGMLNKSSKKRLFGFIDHFFNRLEGTLTVKITEDEAIKRICSSLTAILKVEDIKNCSIMITGTAKIESIEAIYKKIAIEFKDNSYKFLFGGNICYTTKTIDMISECNAVVIVEEFGHTTNTEIAKELFNINDLNKKIIGAILI